MSSKAKKTKRTWKPTIGAKLGPQEQKLRNILEARAKKLAHPEAKAKFLFLSLLPQLKGCSVPPRTMQQRIGAIAARHNRKVKSPHIVRGEWPSTYRLKRIR